MGTIGSKNRTAVMEAVESSAVNQTLYLPWMMRTMRMMAAMLVSRLAEEKKMKKFLSHQR